MRVVAPLTSSKLPGKAFSLVRSAAAECLTIVAFSGKWGV